MFYALLIICEIDAAVCDLDHAVYAEQSSPVFASEDDCVMGTLARLREMPVVTARLKEDAEYQIEIECSMAGEPI